MAQLGRSVMFGETSAIGGDGQVQEVRSGDEIDSILELEGDDDILAQFNTAPKAAGSGSGWTPGGSGSGWTPGGGSVGSGWTPGSGGGGGGAADAAEKKRKKQQQNKKQESANRVGAGSVGGTGRSERGGTTGPSPSTWTPAPFGGSSGAAAPAPTGMGSGLSGSSYREAQRASQQLASSASSLSSSRKDTGPTGIGRSSYTKTSTHGTSAASRASTQTAEELAAELGIDMDDEDSFHAPAPAPTPAPAPAPAPQRLNVHFGIDALEAAEPEAVDESYGDDAFEVSGTENFEDDFEDESFEVVEEDSISISAEDKSTPAPAPAPARSNVHFGIAGLEMPDEVPEPAPAPRRAPAPAPAPSKIGGSNVHFGIAGLEEMSDDAVPAEAESIASGSHSHAISMSMDSLQVCTRSDFNYRVLWSLKGCCRLSFAYVPLAERMHLLTDAGAVKPRHR